MATNDKQKEYENAWHEQMAVDRYEEAVADSYNASVPGYDTKSKR